MSLGMSTSWMVGGRSGSPLVGGDPRRHGELNITLNQYRPSAALVRLLLNFRIVPVYA